MKYVKRDEIIQAVKEAMCPMDYPSELRDSIARTIVSAAESIDIVRCSECKYNRGEHKCVYPNSIIVAPADDDFCSYGKRREQEHG